MDIVADHPTVKNIIVHTGGCDIVKKESEVLKRDFIDLLNTVRSVNALVFISGPPIRGGDERLSRRFALNKWLSTACINHSIHLNQQFLPELQIDAGIFLRQIVCLNKQVRGKIVYL